MIKDLIESGYCRDVREEHIGYLFGDSDGCAHAFDGWPGGNKNDPCPGKGGCKKNSHYRTYAFDEDVQHSMQAGMNAHLNKPVEADHLIRILGELIYESEEKMTIR